MEKVKKEKVEEIVFTKSQFLQSKMYKNKIDILNCVLEDGKTYSTAQVDKLVDDFMKGKVN